MTDDYIKRDDAFNVLTEYYHHKLGVQREALREALSRVPAADVQPVVRWVNVMDRLPEFTGKYLVYRAQNGHKPYLIDVLVLKFYKEQRKWFDVDFEDEFPVDGISHWMPLPVRPDETAIS